MYLSYASMYHMTTYRAYFFTNMYLSGIHTGIQGGHALDQMWLKYTNPKNPQPEKLESLRTFSKRHKTFIMLTGGEHQHLVRLHKSLNKLKFPFEKFVEPGLNNACTAVCVVLPSCMYDSVAKAAGRGETSEAITARNYTSAELKFLKYMNGCGLAK